jgi:hypothetical protein
MAHDGATLSAFGLRADFGLEGLVRGPAEALDQGEEP